ncbi:MAG TPA: 50S ribosomal protein L6 [Candidatus Polarisedimenticolaceae bacterium]|nr:50S ribosomal protein L6 [Candidatus Polarisedimenticolaceae bacterium]
MSRVGRQPIQIPAGVTVELSDEIVTASGPKGSLSVRLLHGITLDQTPEQIRVVKAIDDDERQKTFGLMRTLINNMVVGVNIGFERKLEINGVGYRANLAGRTINLSLGYSHPIAFALPEGIDAKIERNVITLSGADKQLVGQVAANIRSLRKPEPYKGKGIKYVEERIRRKAGKAASK